MYVYTYTRRDSKASARSIVTSSRSPSFSSVSNLFKVTHTYLRRKTCTVIDARIAPPRAVTHVCERCTHLVFIMRNNNKNRPENNRSTLSDFFPLTCFRYIPSPASPSFHTTRFSLKSSRQPSTTLCTRFAIDQRYCRSQTSNKPSSHFSSSSALSLSLSLASSLPSRSQGHRQ